MEQVYLKLMLPNEQRAKQVLSCIFSIFFFADNKFNNNNLSHNVMASGKMYNLSRFHRSLSNKQVFFLLLQFAFLKYFVYLFLLCFGKEKQKKLTTETIAICIFRQFMLHTKFMTRPEGS